MIATPESWPQIWETIEEEMQESAEKNIAVIFSVHEVETVCAVKMLQLGLRTHTIQFSQYPVLNHSDLERTLEQLLTDSQEVRTVVLLNCGAATYVPALAPPSAVNVRFVVVDSHRPIDARYNNDGDVDAVLVLADDDPLELAAIPPASGLDDMTPEQEEQLVAEAQAEQDAEDEAEGDSLDSPAKRQRLGDGSSGARSRRECRDRLRMLRERQRLVSNYRDLGSSYGKPSPLVVLPLAELLVAKCDNALLWPAAVGLTDQWVHQRLSNQHHERWYKQLSDAVAAADANYAAQQAQAGGGRAPAAADGGGRQQAASQARLVAATDHRLVLFRHWTLFDSFANSPYVAARMQTWRPVGRDNLALMFAHMGLSMEQAKTEFNSMQSRSHRMFAQELERAVLKTNMTYRELAADGFQLHHSRKVTAASDLVHACTALLSEYTVGDHGDAEGGQHQAAAGFWAALRALDCHTPGGWAALLKGVQDAKMLQQAIIMDGGLMVSDMKLQANSAAHMQELNLAAVAPTNAAEFRHPLTLLRLAQFVRDASRVARQGSGAGLRAANYPILVIGPEGAAGWCIVIGLRANILAGNAQYNIFGRTFEAVLHAPDNDVRWDTSRQGFDAAVVYVHKDSLVNFSAEVRTQLATAAALSAAAAAAKQTQEQHRQQRDGSDDTRGEDDRQQQQQQPRQRQRRREASAAANDSQQQQQQRGISGGAEAAADDDGDLVSLPASEAELGPASGQLDDMVSASEGSGGGGLEDDGDAQAGSE